MKLRKAIKIWRKIDRPFDSKGRFQKLKWKLTTKRSAHCRCRRAYLDDRVPYMESDEELEERADMMFCILADISCDNEEESQEWKDRYFEGKLDDLPAS